MSEQIPRIVPSPDQQEVLLGAVAFPDEWAAQVARQSGHSPEFEESVRRAAEYTTEDWRQIMEEEQSICTRLSEVMATGAPPESDAAMDLAEEHRSGLRRWFFNCTPEVHVAFAQMFDADERMRAASRAWRTVSLATFVAPSLRMRSDLMDRKEGSDYPLPFGCGGTAARSIAGKETLGVRAPPAGPEG